MYKEQHCRTRSKSLFGLVSGGGKIKDVIFFWENQIGFVMKTNMLAIQILVVYDTSSFDLPKRSLRLIS